MQAMPTQPLREHPSLGQLFAYPFRIFFLSMAALALLVIPLWVMEVTGVIHMPLAIPGLYWHQHEMLFGFLSAAIAGFLLTAVCVWTGTERSHGKRLLLLWGVWLAGRLVLALGAGLPDWLVYGINLAFLPLVMADAGWRIWHARQKRQLMILVVLGLLWVMQAGFLIRLDMAYSHGALVMAMALISIIGGRITPAFTQGWLRQRGQDSRAVKTRAGLDLSALVTMILLLAALVSGLNTIAAILAVAGALIMLARIAGWHGWLVRTEPLLWILHLSILWIPVALLLLAGSLLAGWPTNAWSHAAGAGAISCLILGVAARVALGHTGRPLALPGGMVTAFAAIQVGALIRVLTAFGLIPWHPGIGASSLLWLLAFGLFLARYWRILASPRPDGREG